MSRASRRLPTFLEEAEIKAIITAATRQRDRLMLFLMRYLGFRVADVTRARVEDLDFKAKSIWIRGGKGGVDACLPIPSWLVGPLRAWAGSKKTGWLFPSPRGDKQLTTRAIQLLLKKLAVKAGVRDPLKSRRVTPHKLRHGFCTGLIAQGVDIAAVRDLMRHSSIAVTDRYAHCVPERLRDALGG